MEEFRTPEELRTWTVKQLKEELALAARRAPRALTNQKPALVPLDKGELVAAVELARGGESARCCAICVEDFASGDVLRVLQCAHRFHIECIDRWLLDADHGCCCPMCKSPLA
jgi:E3 ubiquitin-protein ligase RNF38/44